MGDPASRPLYLIYQQIGVKGGDFMFSSHGAFAVVCSNARVKLYPASPVMQIANDRIFREKGFHKTRPYSVPSKGKAKDVERSEDNSRKRARTAVRDIALCNHFSHFLTLTLDASKVDRYDPEAVASKVQNWLKNMTRRKNFSYVIVPELHADGAIHFHGLCTLGSLSVIPALNAKNGRPMTTDRGQPIFNVTDWKLGFSTCIPIDENYERTCNYITKYITKDCRKIFGKWYYSSRGLVKKPDSVLLSPVSFAEYMKEHPDEEPVNIFGDVLLFSKALA